MELQIVAPPPIISRAPPPLPSVLTLPVLVREGLSHNSLTFPFPCLFNGESFHYPTPMDPPCPGLATDSRKERESYGSVTLVDFLPFLASWTLPSTILFCK
ncbi:hypothetical protein TNCV_2204061 [Trichonephila clavipes]|nr:hypothetical protein TNCV_2204061 [Trichonephila clavipes]